MVFIMFFCFKQKTSYEMRINDWSSDVCSSDLKPVPLEGRRAVGLITQTGGVSGQTRLALEALGPPVSYSICTGNEAVLCAADFLDFKIDDAATDVILVRSEEPTSELQSLMRLSNDVFCMKITNN